MIVSFYDNNFKGLQDNSSLVIDEDNSYKLVKRPTELNDLSCKCEAFTESIQPTFLVISDKRGNYIYGSLAGIPQLNKDNKTEINGTDLKSMLASDVILEYSASLTTVNEVLSYIFQEWKQQHPNGFEVKLLFKEYMEDIPLTDLVPDTIKQRYDAWEEFQIYLKFYNLYLDTYLDIANKEVHFIIGKTMYRQLNIKLWEHDVKNYGKWVANRNETQGYYIQEDGTWVEGTKWILTSDNKITNDETKRDIYPIKRSIITSDESLQVADKDALTELLDSMFNENIELETTNINPDMETRFEVYVRRGEEKYKDLPCGELHYDINGLVKVQIGYRFTGIQFI